jgi:superkiller protein 3
VLVERKKYIDLPIAELYDLAADPKEAHNLASAEPDLLKVLFNTLRTYNIAPPNRPARESAETVGKLNALGYVSGSAPEKKIYTEADDPKSLVDIDNDMHTATDLTQNGRTEDAIAVFNKVIARRPDTADAYISLAHAYWESGRTREAIATLEAALKAGAPDRDVRIRLGIYLAESHADTARAITVLEGLPVSDVEALNALSIAYGDAGKFEEAKATLNKLLTLDPTNGIAYFNLASMTLREAQAAKSAAKEAKEQEAERFARKALELDPSLAGAFTTLGVILSDTGRKSDAVEAFKRAVDLDGTEFNALYNLWLLLASAGRHDEAVAYGKQFLATAPKGLVEPSQIEEIRKYIGG